jgi:YggT family protein
VICTFILRIVLQLVHANFYNPISQLIWKITQPVTMPLTRVLPRYKNLDVAATLILVVLATLDILIVGSLYSYGLDWLSAAWLGALKVVSLGLRVYLLSLLIVAILSWVGPGLSNPAANVLWSITEPVLRPVRRILPAIAGLDLSPIPVMIVFQALDKFLQSKLGLFY